MSNGIRVSEIVTTRPSHIPGMPYEVRKTVTTDWRNTYNGDAREFSDIPDDERKAWEEWLDDMHEQDVRAAEMEPFNDEESALIGAEMNGVDWEWMPVAWRNTLDMIEKDRAALPA